MHHPMTGDWGAHFGSMQFFNPPHTQSTTAEAAQTSAKRALSGRARVSLPTMMMEVMMMMIGVDGCVFRLRRHAAWL